MVIKMISLILGGGSGTRLYPLTAERSKPAVPIAGKYRLIDIPISNCLNSGVKRMFVLTQFNSASLNQHIQNTYNFDMFSRGFVDILAAEQTPGSNSWFQGTADAVRQSMHHLLNHDFDYILILSGDQLYQMDFEELAKYHIAQKAELTIATIPVNAEDATGFGIMKVDKAGYISKFIEKPAAELLPNWKSEVSDACKKAGKEYLASMGIYIFNKNALIELFDKHQEATDFGKEIIPSTISAGAKVASFQFDGYWTDIGTIRSFFDANLELADNIPQFNLFDNTKIIYTHPRLLAPSKIFGTKLNGAVLAEGCIIHADDITRSIIGIRSRIEKNTTIDNCIIMGNDYFQTIEEMVAGGSTIPMGIGKNCVIKNAIIDKNCRIGNNVEIIGSEDLENVRHEDYCITDGIVVVRKGRSIASGTKIGASKIRKTLN